MTRRLLIQLFLSVVLIGIACITLDARIIQISEKFLDDNWYRLVPERRAEDRIAVIEIDDRTLEYYFPEIPLPRDQIALLIAGLIEEPVKVRVVAIDLYFEGPDKVALGNDTLLAYKLLKS
jgi:CHASE2 domain-containing sensor protein